MSGRPMTRDTLLAALGDIRLPAEAPGGWAAEALAAAGLGLLIAALIGVALHAVTVRARPARGSPPAIPDALGDEARSLALLQRLKRERPDRFAPLAERLYRPGGLPDADALERELARP